MCAALAEDSERLKSALLNFKPYGAPGAAAVLPVLAYAQRAANRHRLQTASLTKIIDRIDSDTYYWDLLLWIVVPAANGEVLLGDLNEEYLLRQSKEGEAGARAWYQDQVTATVKHHTLEEVRTSLRNRRIS